MDSHFYDSLLHLVRDVHRDRRSLIEHLAIVPQRFLCTFPIYMLWGGIPRHGVLIELERISQLSPSEVSEKWAEICSYVDVDSARPGVWLEDGILCLHRHERRLDPWRKVWLQISYHEDDPQTRQRAEWLFRNTTAQQSLFILLDTLQALFNASTSAELRVELETFQRNVGNTPVPARLQQATQLLERWCSEPWSWNDELKSVPRALAKNLTVQVLHDVFSLNPRQVPRGSVDAFVRQVRLAATLSPQGDSLVNYLEQIADTLETATLHAADVNSTIEAWFSKPTTPPIDNKALGLSLLMWARRAYAITYSTASRPENTATSNGPWGRLSTQHLRPLLAEFLVRHAPNAGKQPNEDVTPINITRLRHWLHAWFCLKILSITQDYGITQPTLLSDEVWEARRAACYLVGEIARAVCFGSNPGYHVRPAPYAAALRTLVISHALAKVRVPRSFGLRRFLRDIGEPHSAADYHSSTGHLQHVLDIYVAGHFMLNVTLDGEQRPDGDSDNALATRTVGACLAAHAGARAQQADICRLERAFSLAAIFHDAGILFGNTSYNAPQLGFGRDDHSLQTVLEARQTLMADANAPLLEHCSEELYRGGFVEDDEQDAFHAWVAKQRLLGAPDHALTGGWYLQRLGSRIPEMDPALQRNAVRAVLLHGARTLPIHLHDDPVAALLVFCDELFEWESLLRREPSANAVGRSLQAMAVPMSPSQSRVESLLLPGISVSPQASGSETDVELNVRFRASPERPQESLNRRASEIQLGTLVLRPPEQLYAHVHQLWLSMAQNLGRIRTGSRKNGSNRRYLALAVQNRAPWPIAVGPLLYQLAATSHLPPAPAIARWLLTQVGLRANPTQFGEHRHTDNEQQEIVIISEHHRLVYDQDIRYYANELDDSAERIARDAELRQE